MGKLRNCSRCGTETENECPVCLDWFENHRPDPVEMTPEERMTEMESWKIVEIAFDKIHQRIEELVGRSVWTHEIGLNWEGLVKEAGERPGMVDMEKVMESLAATGKPIIGVVAPDKEEEE